MYCKSGPSVSQDMSSWLIQCLTESGRLTSVNSRNAKAKRSAQNESCGIKLLVNFCRALQILDDVTQACGQLALEGKSVYDQQLLYSVYIHAPPDYILYDSAACLCSVLEVAFLPMSVVRFVERMHKRKQNFCRMITETLHL